MFIVNHIIAQSPKSGYVITDRLKMAVKTSLQGM